ncbi:MAG: FHA domain-containing protein [Capsulimonadaceae bacterium]|nr:FHA domain-containing protein [Capsulimonadaceae bacterium]
MKNYYQILGVSETASDEEIRSAYRRLLQESLMDKERFDSVKQAFEALRTPDRRSAYDQSLLRANQDETPSAARKTGTARLSAMSEPEKTTAVSALPCPVCGHRNAAGEDYCSECGFLLSSTAQTSTPLQETSNVSRRPHLAGEQGEIFPLRAGVNTVGREHGDIVLPDKTVSRHHAHIVYDEDRGLYSVEDTDSTNGTSVNGQRLLPRVPHPVLPGDDVQFGSVPLKLVAFEKTAVMAVTDVPEENDDPHTEVVAELQLVRGTGPEEIPIVSGNNTIGRMPDNRICIRNDRYISGHHASIEAEQGVFRLIDVGSTNGTFLNGLRLTTNEAIAISEGDEITLGGTVYVFHQNIAGQVSAPAKNVSAPSDGDEPQDGEER